MILATIVFIGLLSLGMAFPLPGIFGTLFLLFAVIISSLLWSADMKFMDFFRFESLQEQEIKKQKKAENEHLRKLAEDAVRTGKWKNSNKILN